MTDVPNATQMRDALAWVTQDQAAAKDPQKDVWVWLWEAIQGDFSQERSTGQIAFDAAISMIPIEMAASKAICPVDRSWLKSPCMASHSQTHTSFCGSLAAA